MPKLKVYVTKVSDGHYDGKLATSITAIPVVSKTGFATDFETRQFLEHELYKISYPYHQMSFYELSQQLNNEEAREALRDKLADLEMTLLFEKIAKQDMPENQAHREVNILMGKKWTERVEKAKNNTLDALVEVQQEMVEKRLADNMQRVKEMQHIPSAGAISIINLLKKIPGSKMATISLSDRVEVFDINAKGKIGYAPEHFNSFGYLLDRGIKEQAVLMIRQFIPGTEELTTFPNGKQGLVPWKAIYGCGISPEGFTPFTAEDVEYSYTHDGADNPIVPEDMVIYKDISDFVNNPSQKDGA